MLSKNPLISIILAVRNEEKSIDKCINSILNQNYKNFELLVIDDNSSDKTYQKIKIYSKKDKRISIYKSKNQVGLPKLLNFLIKITKGEFIARVDGDDYWKKEKLKLQLNEIKIGAYDLIGCNAFFTNKNRIIGNSNLPISHQEIKKNIYYFNPFLHSSVIFRKKKKFDYFYDESFTKCQDYEMWSRMIMSGYKVKNLKKKLIYNSLDKKTSLLTIYFSILVKNNILKNNKSNIDPFKIHLIYWIIKNFIKKLFSIKKVLFKI
jgi:glycosyltransferase involved in cell wall biosynthesis